MQLRKHIGLEVTVEIIQFGEYKFVTLIPSLRVSLVVVSDLLKVQHANLLHQLAAPLFVASWPPRRSAVSYEDSIAAR
jgi:hypothetical protein